MNYEKSKRTRVLFLIVIVMIAVAGTHAVFAEDIKVFPGTICVGRGSSNSSINHIADGGVFNSSSSSPLSLVCPVPRDNPTARYDSIKVVVVDQHPSSNVTCEVHANNRSGFESNKSDVLSSSGSLAAGQVLTFAPIPEFDYGSYTILCVIPSVDPLDGGASGIASYLISEP